MVFLAKIMRANVVWIIISGILLVRISGYFSSLPKYPNGTMLKISSKIKSEPIDYSDSQYFRLKGLKVYLPLYPEVSYGDFVVISGTVEKDALRNIKLIEVKPTKSLIYSLRKKLIEFYKSSLPEPGGSLLAGMVIGSKESIPSGFWQELRNSGTAHIVVASGTNVSLVAGFIMGCLLLVINRKKAVLVSIAIVWFYALMAGFDAPIIRAAAMATIGFTAQEYGKLYNALRSLLITFVVMLLIFPGWITDIGFWLSFTATASILIFEPIVYKRIHKVPDIIRKDFSTSLSAQVGVAPIIFATFGYYSVLSPIANVLVASVVAPLTIIGMLAGVIGVVFEPAGRIILLVCYPLVLWFSGVVGVFG